MGIALIFTEFDVGGMPDDAGAATNTDTLPIR